MKIGGKIDEGLIGGRIGGRIGGKVLEREFGD